ncbi:MAG: thermonuclease family protein [Acidobacteria bacterium]|nr:thermonuclease family protein [Acidobacteriota bacterium]
MLLMIAILCMGPQASGRQLSGKVVEVLTGSKIVVNAKGKRFLVSLREADCPEPGQPYFKDALALTESLVDGQFVIVTIESANEDKIVGEVQYINSQNLSFQLLKAGMAFWSPETGKVNSYKNMEQNARDSKTGMFKTPDLTPPWEYRENIKAENDKKRSN